LEIEKGEVVEWVVEDKPKFDRLTQLADPVLSGNL
jgi:hypothetical protein